MGQVISEILCKQLSKLEYHLHWTLLRCTHLYTATSTTVIESDFEHARGKYSHNGMYCRPEECTKLNFFFIWTVKRCLGQLLRPETVLSRHSLSKRTSQSWHLDCHIHVPDMHFTKLKIRAFDFPLSSCGLIPPQKGNVGSDAIIKDTIKQVYHLAEIVCPWGFGTCALTEINNDQ